MIDSNTCARASLSSFNMSRPRLRKSRGTAPKVILNKNAILSAACHQWLNVSQITYLLDPKTSPLPISSGPPKRQPPSGTLILYNRVVTRRYKDDGYRWVKKRNSNKVREDHVKLRIDGVNRVSGSYVHCMDNLNFHRRAYHLLDDSAPEEPQMASIPENATVKNKPTQSLVLVHYLDTRVASMKRSNQASDDGKETISLIPTLSVPPAPAYCTAPTMASSPTQTFHGNNPSVDPTLPPVQSMGHGRHESMSSQGDYQPIPFSRNERIMNYCKHEVESFDSMLLSMMLDEHPTDDNEGQDVYADDGHHFHSSPEGLHCRKLSLSLHFVDDAFPEVEKSYYNQNPELFTSIDEAHSIDLNASFSTKIQESKYEVTDNYFDKDHDDAFYDENPLSAYDFNGRTTLEAMNFLTT